MNSAIFAAFLRGLDTQGRDVLLMDNASIHKTAEVLSVCDARNLYPCFLPPYTPEFQPIEHCFALLKAAYRKQDTPAADAPAAAPLPCATPHRRKPDDAVRLARAAALEESVRLRVTAAMGLLSETALAGTFRACWKRAMEASAE